jgi:tripartite-type tricarboxylate transporter receptor subunit TctC
MEKTTGFRMMVVIFVVLFFCASQILGQEKKFPDTAINLYIGYPPGGGVGNAAQILAEGLKKNLGQPVIVNFKPGAAQAIAGDFVFKCKPDGYSLLYVTETDFIPKLIKDASLLKYSMDDFVSLGASPYSPYALAVNAESPWKTLDDLIAHGRKSPPGTLSYGSVGVATTAHLSAELFSQLTGIALNHIPFQGGGPADTALMGGHVHMCFGSVGRFGARLRPGGGLRPLAILDKKRAPDFPDVPTMLEKGYDMQLLLWNGLHAPKGLPNDVKSILVRAFEKTAKDPEMISALSKAGYYHFYLNPEGQDKQIQTDYKVLKNILSKAGLLN